MGEIVKLNRHISEKPCSVLNCANSATNFIGLIDPDHPHHKEIRKYFCSDHKPINES